MQNVKWIVFLPWVHHGIYWARASQHFSTWPQTSFIFHSATGIFLNLKYLVNNLLLSFITSGAKFNDLEEAELPVQHFWIALLAQILSNWFKFQDFEQPWSEVSLTNNYNQSERANTLLKTTVNYFVHRISISCNISKITLLDVNLPAVHYILVTFKWLLFTFIYQNPSQQRNLLALITAISDCIMNRHLLPLEYQLE